MPSPILVTFKVRGDTAANWAAVNPVLADREIGFDKTNKTIKVGDGATAWNSLAGISVALSDDSVTNAKLANMAQATIKGRQAGSGTGDPEDLTATQARTALGLGTSATVDTGTSGATIPLLNAANTFSASQTLTGLTVSMTGSAFATIKDSDSAGSAAVAFLEFRDSANARSGYVGKGNAANSDLYVQAESGYKVRIGANGGTVIVIPGILGNYASDVAAAAGGVAIGEMYRNGSALMIRVA